MGFSAAAAAAVCGWGLAGPWGTAGPLGFLWGWRQKGSTRSGTRTHCHADNGVGVVVEA
jgi:hypothetical protein